jgi:hypothetical protein
MGAVGGMNEDRITNTISGLDLNTCLCSKRHHDTGPSVDSQALK